MKNAFIAALGLLWLGAPAWCQAPAAQPPQDVLRSQLAQFLRAELALAHDVRISVQPLDPSLNLAPCPEPVYTLAQPKADLRGSIRVEIRCRAPQVWAIYTSATLAGPQRPDRALSAPAPAGDALQLAPTRTVPVVKAGQVVTLLASGPGFRISAEGRALASASDGQAVQVRTVSGHVIHGNAMPDGMVSVR